MNRAVLRFYEELNDFLPLSRQKQDVEVAFRQGRSVKDMIEAQGVPHTEVDLILVNGRSVDFGYGVQHRDRISVYPVFESLDISNVTHLRQIPLRNPRFIADTHLGDMVKTMRALGLNVVHDPDLSPAGIIRLSHEQKRTILTKSRKLLKHRAVTHGIFIRPGTVIHQIRGIIDLLCLDAEIQPFSRCLQCNTPLVPVAKQRILDRIPPRVQTWCDQFTYCPHCDQIYWPGTHFTRLKQVVDAVLGP